MERLYAISYKQSIYANTYKIHQYAIAYSLRAQLRQPLALAAIVLMIVPGVHMLRLARTAA
jgi:hypothetical protein